MHTKIKKIRAVAVSNLLILGLAACSSTPAPWTQHNDSPWGAKHASESESLPSDDAITDTGDDPVMLDEPEPVVMEEPMAEPEMMAVAPVVVAETSTMTPEEKVLAMPASNYAIQIYASKTIASVDKFKANNDLNELMMVKTDRSGAIVYILVDIYPDKSTANAAAIDIEARTGTKPWVRSVAGIQDIIAR